MVVPFLWITLLVSEGLGWWPACALPRHGHRHAGADAPRQPGDRPRAEADAAVGCGAAGSTAEVVGPVDADLSRATLEFLEDVRPGAGGKRERPAGFIGGERQGLLDEEGPTGRRGRGLADDGRKRRTTRPELLTVTRRAESETRMRQSVSVARVPLAEIHPAWLLGRPGSRTRSQLLPRPPRPSTGRTVGTRVSGRRPDTASIA